MATVTGIEILRGRAVVALDGTVLCRIPLAHFEKCPLKEGEEIDPEAWLARLAGVQSAEAYEAALSCLDVCDRSAKELGNALRRRGFVPPAAEAAIARLIESGLIDDARYARRLAESQVNRPVGIHAFRRRLIAKGIREEDALEALSAFDDDQQRAACLEAARQLWRKYESLPRRQARAKLSQALARRGFGWDAIESATDEIVE